MGTIPQIPALPSAGHSVAHAGAKAHGKEDASWSGLLAAAEAQSGNTGNVQATDTQAHTKTDEKHKKEQNIVTSSPPGLVSLLADNAMHPAAGQTGRAVPAATATAKSGGGEQPEHKATPGAPPDDPGQKDALQTTGQTQPDQTTPAHKAQIADTTSSSSAPSASEHPALPAATDISAASAVNMQVPATAPASTHAPETRQATDIAQPATHAVPRNDTVTLAAAQTAQQTAQPEQQTNSQPVPTATIISTAPITHNTPAPVAATTPGTMPQAAPISLASTALATTVTAMHQNGQSTATLRLDPPDLGSLSVHVALGQGGHVNIVFAPSTAQAAQALHAGLDSFRQAMDGSGLTLGQVEVNAGGTGSGGNGGQPQRQAPSRPPQTAANIAPDNGVRAYA